MSELLLDIHHPIRMHIVVRFHFLILATALAFWDLRGQATAFEIVEEKPIAVLLAAGDISNCHSSRARVEEVASLIEEQINKAATDGLPLKVLALGDIAYRVRYGGVTHRTYKACLDKFNQTWGRFKKHILPVPGNHDYSDDPNSRAPQFFEYFSDFFAGTTRRSEHGSYHVLFPKDHPNAWSLFAFNFYGDRRADLKYAESELSQLYLGCVLAFTHPFYLSSGHHGHRLGDFTYSRMKPFWRSLAANRGSIMLTAHDHHFEQFKKLDARGRPNVSAGMRQFVVGTGGAPLYITPSPKRHAHSEYFNDKDHGVLKIELFADSYRWSFLKIDDREAVELPVNKDFCNRP